MIRNEHQRHLSAPPDLVGRLVDALAGPDDRLWPHERWPAMRFDRPLGAGARGGHGPIRYWVEGYRAGKAIRLRFEAPAGFDGHHEYVVVPRPDGDTVLRHTLVLRTTGAARLTWPLLYRPLHDALIEDSLDKAARSLGLQVAHPRRWSWWVRRLRAARPSPAERRSAGYHPADARGL